MISNYAVQSEPSIRGSRKSQRARILELLVKNKNSWVPLPLFVAISCQYGARIMELRRQGFVIENRTENLRGVRHSWFRLTTGPRAVQPVSPPKKEPQQQRLFPTAETSAARYPD